MPEVPGYKTEVGGGEAPAALSHVRERTYVYRPTAGNERERLLFFSSFSFVGGAAREEEEKIAQTISAISRGGGRRKANARRCLISMLLPDRRAKSGGGIQQVTNHACREKYLYMLLSKTISAFLEKLLVVKFYTFFRESFFSSVYGAGGFGEEEFQTQRRKKKRDHAWSMRSPGSLLSSPPFAYLLLPKFPTASSVSMPGWLALCHTTLIHTPTKSTMCRKEEEG